MKKNLDMILVADRSTSMEDNIKALNDCISEIAQTLKSMPGYTDACNLYLSVLQFPVFPGEDTFVCKAEKIKRDKEKLVIPEITSKGATNPAGALLEAVTFGIKRYEEWGKKGDARNHPIIFFLTDGKPNAGSDTRGGPVDPEEQKKVMEEYMKVASEIKKYQEQKKIQFYGFGIGNADLDMIKELTIYTEDVYDLTKINIMEAFDAFKNNLLTQTDHTTNEDNIDNKIIIENKKYKN